MELWISSIIFGLLYSLMAIGVLITFRIQNIPDMTVDGSFTTGAAVVAILLVNGVEPITSIIIATIVSAFTGFITGMIHTKLKIDSLLSGIIVMIGLYSVNLHIMERSNIPLLDSTTLFSYLDKTNLGMSDSIWYIISLAILIGSIWLLLSYFFKSDFGILIRISGENPVMASANSGNVNLIKIFSLSLSNGIIGLSGALVAQYQGFADIGMGIGTIVIGLASVIIGTSLIKSKNISIYILSVIIGSILFRILISIALYFGMNPIDLKLLTAIFVLITLGLTKVYNDKEYPIKLFLNNYFKKIKSIIVSLIVLVVVIVGIYFVIISLQGEEQKFDIGIVQISHSTILDVTRESFIKEMTKLGYDSTNIEVQNANNDLPTLNSIISKYINDKKSIIIAISSKATQVAAKSTKEIPIVFATVANPFILGVGTDDYNHQANVTGVYGSVPQDSFLSVVRMILPSATKLGVIWDPSQPNAVYNVEILKNSIEKNKLLKFVGTTVNGTSEVLEGANSLVNKNIDVFCLPPDNVIYSAFESVIKASQREKIPIFINDIERLKDGALCAFGYDYTTSGIQAAQMVDKILKGKNPKLMPFEQYKKLTIGVNLKVAKDLGIVVSKEVLEVCNLIIDENGNYLKGGVNESKSEVSKKKLAIFVFNENNLLLETARGLKDGLKKLDVENQYNIKIDEFNSENEYSIAQSISQDLIMKNYNYVVTISTVATQIFANVNKNITHIFGAVTDPYSLGIAKDSINHKKNVTGVATFQPVENTLALMRKMFPKAKRIGIVWNPSEACSQACTRKARLAALKYGFELVEANITQSSEVVEATNSIIKKGVDLFLTSGDNTVMLTIPTLAKLLADNKIPYFTNTFSDVEKGVFATLGADYYEVGRRVAEHSERIFKGESAEKIPIENYVPQKFYLNLQLAKKLGLNLNNEIINSADKVLR